MITIYDTYGVPHQVTIQEYIALEAEELARLMEMASKDGVL
jgi:aromatic ring-opening dioxygenase catalytic subunit (LigB family)